MRFVSLGRLLRPRFSLRTLFAAMTALGLWLGYQFDWIRQRHELLARNDERIRTCGKADHFWQQMGPGRREVAAPGMLRWFGEQGRQQLFMVVFVENLDIVPAEVSLAKRLFPEAYVSYVALDMDKNFFLPDSAGNHVTYWRR